MTVFLISVGVSLLENVENYRKLLPDPAVRTALRDHSPVDLFEAVTAAAAPEAATATEAEASSRWLTGALAPAGGPAHDPAAAEALRSRVAAARPDLWPASLSAELDTFAHATQAGQLLGRSDTAILICSDTVRGLLAGVWNAVALAGGDVSRVRYVVEPGQVKASEVGMVTIARVPGMDAGTEAGFVEAMSWMGSLAKGLLDHSRLAGEPLECHLSGGYKAAIPYLIGLAEWIRSAGQGGTVEAFVRHEATTGRPIRLPLRQIPPETVKHELGQGWDKDGCHDGCPAGLLEGYAYDYNETLKKWELTPYGVGLRAVFGFRQPGFGG